MDIAVFHAVPLEARVLAKGLSNPTRAKAPSGRTAVCGDLGRHRVCCIETGVGKVNASMSAALALAQYRPEIAISMGIGGAYPNSGLNVGDIAVADCEIYGDEGVMLKDNFLSLRDIGIAFYQTGITKYYNTFTFDTKLTGRLYDTVSQKYKNTRSGAFVTVSTCTGTKERAAELIKRYNGICENMEGAALAHICTIFNIPAVEIRGISNIAADRDKDSWDIPKASQIAQDAVIMFVKSLE
ncbi:MAG: futalosine hydrolase [Nitrospirae bacterium]|nr:futalosine hydrolase [Nitrospirota bacterium]